MKRKKLYYVPGIISIMMLPVLFFFIGPEDPVRPNSFIFRLAATEKDTTGIAKFTEDYVFQELKNKKLETIVLQRFPWKKVSFSFDDVLNSADSQIHRFQSAHDTSSVLKIQLNSQNSYGDFVWVMNEAMIQRCNRYAFIDNSIYLFPEPPPVINTSRIEHFIIEIPADARAKPLSKWDVFKEKVAYNYNVVTCHIEDVTEYLFYKRTENKLLAAAFLVLIVIPGIIKMGKFYRHNKSFTA